jgi:hypothetical protein
MAQQADQGSAAVACLECQAQRSCADALAECSLLRLELGGVQPKVWIEVEVYEQADCAGPPGSPRHRLGLPHHHLRRGLSRSPGGPAFAAEWQAETRAYRRIFSRRWVEGR